MSKRIKRPPPMPNGETEPATSEFGLVPVRRMDPRFGFSEMQLAFVKKVASGLFPTPAARAAGYSNAKVASCNMMQKPKILQAIAVERAHYVRASGMSKKKVLDGFLEAINLARLKGEPIAMISGWANIAKMCGYNEPTRHKIDIDVRGHVVIQKLQGMSDAELLRLAEGDPDVIDAEFVEIQSNDEPIENTALSVADEPSDTGI